MSKNELNQVKKSHKKINRCIKKIARLKNIKKIEKLTKEDLSITLLKSESSVAESNFERLFNDDNNNTDDGTSDDKIRDTIHDIRMILNRLGNLVKD